MRSFRMGAAVVFGMGEVEKYRFWNGKLKFD